MEAYTKTLGNRISVRHIQLVYNYVPPNTIGSISTNLGGTVLNGDHVLSGYRNPLWKAQIAAHVQAGTNLTASQLDVVVNTPSSASAEWYTGSPKNSSTHRRGEGTGNYGFLVALGSPSIPTVHVSMAAADNQAISRLNALLASFEGQSPIGEDLGEIGQTFKMLSSPMKSLRSAIFTHDGMVKRAFKRKDTAGIAKGLADAFLEYKFGIAPLIRSTQGVVHGLKNRDYLWYIRHFKATGSSVSAVVSGPTVGFFGTGVGPYYRVRKIVRDTARVQYTGQWSAQSGIDRASVATVLGLKWNQVVPTIWNLLPYSWMIDYVTNIGDILEGIATPWGGVRWVCKTQITEQDSIYWNESAWDYMRANFNMTPANTVSKSFTPGQLHFKGKLVTRSNQVARPIPTFRIDPVGSLGHIANLTALLASKSISHSGLLRSTVKRKPDLPQVFRREIDRRDMKIPYPSFTF